MDSDVPVCVTFVCDLCHVCRIFSVSVLSRFSFKKQPFHIVECQINFIRIKIFFASVVPKDSVLKKVLNVTSSEFHNITQSFAAPKLIALMRRSPMMMVTILIIIISEMMMTLLSHLYDDDADHHSHPDHSNHQCKL